MSENQQEPPPSFVQREWIDRDLLPTERRLPAKGQTVDIESLPNAKPVPEDLKGEWVVVHYKPNHLNVLLCREIKA
jgi:hypothetical protein